MDGDLREVVGGSRNHALGVLVRQVPQLSHDPVGDDVLDWDAEEDDPLLAA